MNSWLTIGVAFGSIAVALILVMRRRSASVSVRLMLAGYPAVLSALSLTAPWWLRLLAVGEREQGFLETAAVIILVVMVPVFIAINRSSGGPPRGR